MTLEQRAEVYIAHLGDMPSILKHIGADCSLVHGKKGEPILIGSSKKISISHKGDILVVAAAVRDVGVDVEDITVKRDLNRLRKLFNIEEAPSSTEEFYQLWTAKEAEAKLMHQGISRELLCRKTVCSLQYIPYKNYIICLAGQEEYTIIDLTSGVLCNNI